MSFRSLEPSELRWTCPADTFDFTLSNEITPSSKIVGQDRAVKAVKLGLEIPSRGYNMFVTGVSGSGRETTVKRILDQIDLTTNKLTDLCYVYNFDDPTRPKALVFSAGKGKEFKEGIEQCVKLLRKNIPVVVNSEGTAAEKNNLLETFTEQKKELMETVEQAAEEAGFAVVSIPTEDGHNYPDILPVVEEKPRSFRELQKFITEGKLTKEQLEDFTKQRSELLKRLSAAARKSHDIDVRAQDELDRMYKRILKPTVTGILGRLSSMGNRETADHVEQIAETILNNTDIFSSDDADADPFAIFEVNLVVDNSKTKKKPVIVERFPDAVRLFGNIDRVLIDNKPYSDHTMIRAGAFLKANGGYLILNALDVVRQPSLWQLLIQTIRNKTVITRPNESSRVFMPVELQPEPVDVDVKVILIGPSWLYVTLAMEDPDFGYLFRIRADFEDRMPRNRDNLRDFARVIAFICQSESILPLNRDAMSAIAEQAVRLTGRQDKISLKFNMVADYVRQASYWASQAGRSVITATDVDTAIREKKNRLNTSEEHALNSIIEKQVMVDTSGSAVGQLNGLAVFSGVDTSFGLPCRITATVSPGVEGIVNVEREAGMSGGIHTKGVYVLTGFLRDRFAFDYPLSLSAEIVFEQSYGGVDGDSASSTELYALLSSLSGVPLRQDIAVTGSVNQHGRIQPIGGVNHKIEGFFNVCSKRGLTGTQGVIIPESNTIHLQLCREVVQAVEADMFHVYPVSTVEEGISLLTGIEAGRRNPQGLYPPDSVMYLADARLRQMAATVRDFGGRH